IFYGTRGSVPTAGADYLRYGGNTTCLRIESECLPSNHWLVLDAGTGIVPLGRSAIEAQVQDLTILFTHYHHDHTQGLLLSPITFSRKIGIHCIGPVECNKSPMDVLEDMMKPPYFSLSFAEVASHFSGTGIDHPSGVALIAHPEVGIRTIRVDDLERSESQNPSRVLIGDAYHRLKECLVIRMLYTNHPERTISYRIEERPTGRVHVFLTDHENMDGTPDSLLRHLLAADLLVMDSQYSREIYDAQTAGYGHGTPDYCVRVAAKVGAKQLGLTHHDPFSSDEDVENIVAAAKSEAGKLDYEGRIFACADYMAVEV
ncbi:MAG: hypothetical protein HYU64_10275, partial [Armatimonadetes bacterium]|nr:hypothetical protein [Armatimonadota bacterium]